MQNILYKTNQTFSLSKLNPYLTQHGQELPYRYIDPSFKQNYTGPVLLKDLYFHNMYNKFNNNNFNNFNIKIKKNTRTKEFVFNPNKFHEKNANVYNNILRNIDKKKYDNNPYVEKYGIFNFGFGKKLQERKLIKDFFNKNNEILINNNNNKRKFKTIKHKKIKTIYKKKIDNYYSYQLPSVYDNKDKNNKKIMVNKSTNITNKNSTNNSNIETPNHLTTEQNLFKKTKNKKFDTSSIKKIELSLNF